MRGLLTVLGVGGALLVAAGDAAQAQTFNSGSTGADGAFTPASNVTLTVPPSGIWPRRPSIDSRRAAPSRTWAA